MKLCDLEVGCYFKLAERPYKHNRTYVRTKYDYENGILCLTFGDCNHFSFPSDTEVICCSFDDAFAEYNSRKRGYKNVKGN